MGLFVDLVENWSISTVAVIFDFANMPILQQIDPDGFHPVTVLEVAGILGAVGMVIGFIAAVGRAKYTTRSQGDSRDDSDQSSERPEDANKAGEEASDRVNGEGERDGGNLGPPGEIPRPPSFSIDLSQITDEQAIGSGGNADVTKAVVPTDRGDVTVAVKKPRVSRTVNTETIDRVLAEAETWDNLDDHDHIVGVVDWGSEPVPWIAMEYMDGGHLGARSGDVEIPQALWTAIAVTKGVRHAHRRGVAHLDLKPENVLFRAVDGAWDVPKVADWGLSKQLIKHSTSVEGLSPGYAAPEQFTDEYGSTDDITDIYQLGAVFYELFTGEPPFEDDPTRAMHQVLNQSPAPPSELAVVPDGLDDILLKALAKEKGNRYDDIVYLRDDLAELYEYW